MVERRSDRFASQNTPDPGGLVHAGRHDSLPVRAKLCTLDKAPVHPVLHERWRPTQCRGETSAMDHFTRRKATIQPPGFHKPKERAKTVSVRNQAIAR